MSENAEYIKSLSETGQLPTTAPAIITDLIENMDSIPGSEIQVSGAVIWLHTAGQVEGWLRDFLEAYRDLPASTTGSTGGEP